MNAIYRFFLRWPVGLLSGIAIATLLLLTLMPSAEMPDAPAIPFADKVVHAVMFGLVSCALLMDIGRKTEKITGSMVVAVGVGATLLGIVIEVTQECMNVGRSGEMADAMADFTGAILIPISCYRLLQRYVDLSKGKESKPLSLKSIYGIYTESFPVEEQRPWLDLRAKIEDPKCPLNIDYIEDTEGCIGFITWWNLPDAYYIEHFAIDAAARGGGRGSRAINQFADEHSDKPIVLEVEPAEAGEMASRRIGFYERIGFKPHYDYNYIQPPYSDGLPEVKLVLMTRGAFTLPISAIAREIHGIVYGV